MSRSVVLALAAAGCGNHYRAPEVPRNQLATVSVDARATLLSVDGLAPPSPEHKSKRYNANERHAYWITATFTGDQFLPRVVESGPSGEATARFEPDVPCPTR